MRRCVLPLGLAVALATPAAAQVSRPFPAVALRGELIVVQPPEVALNGASARLAPGARIRGPDNLLLMSAALVGRAVVVNYTLDPSGLLRDIWILNAEESMREPWPRTPEQAQRWSFDPASQTWTRR